VTGNPTSIQALLERARDGDPSAFDLLFERHRERLRRTIAMRIDRRIVARVDASDVLQETCLEAFRRLPKYLDREEMPFFLWLHWIAREKLLTLHRLHLGAEKRTVRYEAPLLPLDTSAQFVSGLMGRIPTPSQELARAELAEKLRMALGQLDRDDRDLILWRHFERLSAREMARLLRISEVAAGKRYIRAVTRLRKLLMNLGISNPVR
jgi:RNA polymerase sigma-70 factor, ECF subfamily